jgi:hypothetical protein
VFLDNRGFDDPQSEWEDILPEAMGNMVRKRLHPAPCIDSIDPAFNTQYDESKHGEKLARELVIGHLSPVQQRALRDLIKKYWPVFDELGVIHPVKSYECEIDTGTHPPIACKSVTYGPLETPKIEANTSSF